MSNREEIPEQDSPRPFNPLSKESLGRSLTDAFLKSVLYPLPPTERFPGAGVYALYYTGHLPIYKELASRNPASDLASPIYVGKAVPSGSRKGGTDFDSAIGHALYTRLKNHAESIRESENLKLEDFRCRYLIVDDVWIPLAESLLIAKFRPPWNVVLDGFGNNAQGKGRIDQKISSWDVIHPGRKRVSPLKPSTKSRDEIEAKIAAHFREVR